MRVGGGLLGGNRFCGLGRWGSIYDSCIGCVGGMPTPPTPLETPHDLLAPEFKMSCLESTSMYMNTFKSARLAETTKRNTSRVFGRTQSSLLGGVILAAKVGLGGPAGVGTSGRYGWACRAYAEDVADDLR
jgi:hypothetical protein